MRENKREMGKNERWTDRQTSEKKEHSRKGTLAIERDRIGT